MNKERWLLSVCIHHHQRYGVVGEGIEVFKHCTQSVVGLYMEGSVYLITRWIVAVRVRRLERKWRSAHTSSGRLTGIIATCQTPALTCHDMLRFIRSQPPSSTTSCFWSIGFGTAGSVNTRISSIFFYWQTTDSVSSWFQSSKFVMDTSLCQKSHDQDRLTRFTCAVELWGGGVALATRILICAVDWAADPRASS